MKTAKDSSVVITSPILSPESGGRLNDKKAKNEISVLGTIVFMRKNRARRLRCSVYVNSGYGSWQQSYFLTVRATLKPVSQQEIDSLNVKVVPGKVQKQYHDKVNY